MPEILSSQKKIERMDVFLYLTGSIHFVLPDYLIWRRRLGVLPYGGDEFSWCPQSRLRF
ncbi:MAG: hypothetical protein SOY74_01125 [Allisonella histaminiformans]|uniref:hypothetical protein n=1 Tax=Allisonella histaminiformans TaxID=209880 RepID=UPI002A810028|nr:hypothetical protein [Allisonella histaminiformans]MDY3956793.1 hypothetical protein [Allisonella histaminiformans]